MPAVFENRNSDNAPGRYYIDSQCYDCGLCVDICPTIFKRNGKKRYSFVGAQPEQATHEKLCKEALETCPCGAIGDDGK
ncbi:putative ferredoxin [Chloroherpeton thalassium ATCC 35110]|uniref:Putative ferredoxin n=1 Tax=Chloroherpeton thalassium (strain ATCC 35110 / GB-78) TaxID=517418 RepID=B3QTY0_CHLT3|nr:ferredoxin [Chloroherpeton thalassium]ACF12778.1 putative ferredoxin [Chloroherpeton thalassium ATCC 35110]